MVNKLVFLQTDEDFNQFRRSLAKSSAYLKLRIRFNTNQNTPRFGFIIPKKVLPKVTDRNKIKRRLKTILLKHLSSVKPADYLFFPQKPALKMTFDQIEQETVNLFKQGNVWKFSKG